MGVRVAGRKLQTVGGSLGAVGIVGPLHVS
jgi:hypothetical protein